MVSSSKRISNVSMSLEKEEQREALLDLILNT
jgi:hypothetical protein